MCAPTVKRFARIAAVVLATTGASAQTTYRWIDPSTGRTVLSDLPPPPGAKQVIRYTTSSGVNELQLPYAVRQASEKFPVILYTSVGCTTCKEARTLLDRRGIPFTERVANSEEDLAELARQLGGEALLPSISVGRQSAKGFSPAAWNELLDAAGYPGTPPYRVRPADATAE